jgi:acetate kinase
MERVKGMHGGDLILSLNSGSSSLKFGLYAQGDSDELPVLTGSATGIGRDHGDLNIHAADGKPIVQRSCIHESQVEALATLAAEICTHVQSQPVAIGHRVVHGGPDLRSHQLITTKVLQQLRAATHFAPLHIPQALELISSSQSIFRSARQFACFDNAFHRTLPEVAYHLPLPSRYLDAGIRRYGFHGLSYASLVHHLGFDLPPRAIFAHLGNGASLCALRDGRSIDTTMCFTPTSGIPMGTRCGDLDPGVVLFLLRNEKLNVDELEELLNHASGLFALSSGESDVKALESRAQASDPQAILALEIFVIAIRKAIGAYVALLGGVDMLVFTGGIGEHSVRIRSAVTQGLQSIGVTPETIKIIPADEERQIARHCRALMQERAV